MNFMELYRRKEEMRYEMATFMREGNKAVS